MVAVGVVLRSSFDENQFGAAAHLRDAIENIGDVPRFITGGNNYTDDRLPFRLHLRTRTRDYEVGQAKMPYRPQLHGDFVGKGRNQRDVQRQQNLLRRPDHFEIGQVEQVFQILPRQPVLQWLLFREPRPFGDAARAFP